jgi:hypothetical protein
MTVPAPTPIQLALGSWREPPIISLYGKTGAGKTSDCIWAFAETGVYITERADGVKVDREVLGWQLRPDQLREAYNLTGAINILWQIAQHEQGRYLAVIFDDMSMLCKNELKTMKESKIYNTQVPGSYSFALWTDLVDRILQLFEIARFRCNLFVLANWHVRSGDTDKNGVYHRGGPAFPSLKQIEPIQHGGSSCWRCVYEADNKPWQWVYENNPSPYWVMKDRHNLRGIFPMNIGEALRSVGYNIPRPVSLTWMDDFVSRGSERLDEGMQQTELKAKLVEVLGSQVIEQHIYWILRDAIDRSLFRKRQGLLDLI